MGYINPLTGVWVYEEGDKENLFSTLLNRLGNSIATQLSLAFQALNRIDALTSISNNAQPLTARSGWSMGTQHARKRSGVVMIDFYVTRTGAPITVPANGNISNQAIAEIDAGWIPPGGIIGTLQGIGTSSLAAAQIEDNSVIILTAMAPGSTIATGDQVALGGTYVIA